MEETQFPGKMRETILSFVTVGHSLDLSNILLAPLILFVLVKYKAIWNLLQTLPRDFQGLYRGLTALFLLKVCQCRNDTVGKLFNKTVEKYPNRVCFYYNDEKWTFRQVHQFANKVGNYFSRRGFQNGDVICLFMENSPEYIPLWMGLAKIGVIPALINTNLRLESLTHSLQVVKCKGVIYAEELSQALQDVLGMGSIGKIPMYSYARDGRVDIQSARNLAAVLNSESIEEPVPVKPISYYDPLFYIYTSGTTGLPKAAIIKHARFFMGAIGSRWVCGLRSSDTLYVPLPLYHSMGGMVAAGQSIFFGVSLVLRKKFSASTFWEDCSKYEVTVIQYIGEICRYLLARPPLSTDREHKVRLMFGVGLRKSIWEEFVRRFGIRRVSEIYGSSEGNCNMVNFDGTVGAVGFIPSWLSWMSHIYIVRVNKEGDLVRDPKTGLAILCKADEAGEFVGKVIRNHVYKDFQGYADLKESKNKIAYDVLRKGDIFFRTGDIMLMDAHGYIFFKDRSGDTFRWKGENVSTAEVEAVISNICDLKDCAVYGVQVPGTEGKAGMATIVDAENNLDWLQLVHKLNKSLPAYARPLFVRTTNCIDLTGTFKLKKVDLQEEGFDINKIQDDVHFLRGDKYVKLDKALYENIMSGQIRL